MTNQELVSLREENARLNKELNSVTSFFNKLSEEILDRCLKKAIKDIREFSKTKASESAKFLGDDYDFLNLFEQLCVVYDRGESDNYIGVDDYIENICSKIIDNLSPDESYILNHEYSDDCDINNEVELEGRVIYFLTNYTNKNIRKTQNFN
jgi:hypothetical protein